MSMLHAKGKESSDFNVSTRGQTYTTENQNNQLHILYTLAKDEG